MIGLDRFEHLNTVWIGLFVRSIICARATFSLLFAREFLVNSEDFCALFTVCIRALLSCKCECVRLSSSSSVTGRSREKTTEAPCCRSDHCRLVNLHRRFTCGPAVRIICYGERLLSAVTSYNRVLFTPPACLNRSWRL